MAAQLAAVVEGHDAVGILDSQPGDPLRSEDLGTETFRLRRCPPRQIGAAHPLRKAEVILDSCAGAGLSAGGVLLDHDRLQPLGRPVDRGGEPGGAGTYDDQVVKGSLGVGRHADLVRQGAQVRIHQGAAVGEEQDRQTRRSYGGRFDQRSGLGIAFDVQPLVGDLAAREEFLDLVRTGRPKGAGDANAVVWHRHAGEPVAQQFVQNGVEPVLRRVPGLHQVVVETDGVDAGDGGIGICIGGQQHPFRLRIKFDRFAQEFHPAHRRHALVGEQQRQRCIAALEFLHRLQGFRPGTRLDDAVVVLVVRLQISCDGVEHVRLVVDGHDDRFVHGALCSVGNHSGGLKSIGRRTVKQVRPGCDAIEIWP